MLSAKLPRALSTAILLFIAACGESLTTEELLARSKEALESGELRAATIDAKAALQKEPRNAVGRRLLGDIAMRRATYPEAASEYEKALSFAAQDPEITAAYVVALIEAAQYRELLDEALDGRFLGLESNAVILAGLANAEGAVGNRQKATELIEQALSSTADHPFVRLVEIRHLAGIGRDIETARAKAELLSEEYPDYAPGHSVLAAVSGLQGDTATSIAAYEKAIAVNKRRLRDRLGLVGALLSSAETERATEEVESLDKVIPDSPLLNYYQGRLALADGRIQDGLTELDTVLRDVPTHPGALYYAGLANLETGNLATSERQLQGFLAGNPQNIEARLALGRLYLQSAEPDRATVMAENILKDFSANIPALRILATALAMQGAYMQSADVYAQVLSVEEQPSAETQLQLGISLVRAGDKSGIAELEKARDMDPSNERARRLLVASYLAIEDGDKAMQEAQAFAAVAPEAAAPYLLVATVELWRGAEAKAAEAFDQALEIDPSSAEGLRGKAGLAMRAGDMERAAAVYEEALRQNPDELSSLLPLATIYSRAGNIDGMESTLQSAIEKSPEALPPRILLARHWLSTGKYADGVQLLVEVRDDNEDSADLQELLAGGFLALGESASALGAARQLLELRPDNARSLRTLAVAEQAEKQFELSEKHIKESLELEPGDPQSRKTLIELFILQEKYDDLAAYLADMPAEIANAPDVKIAQGRIELLRGDAKAAIGFLEDAHRKSPDTRSTFFLVTAYFQDKRFSDGERTALSWLEEHPEEEVVLQVYSTYLLANGRDDDAAPLLERLVANSPDDVSVLNNLAWAYRSSNGSRALTLVDDALAAQPANMSILDTKSVILKELGRYEEALAESDKALKSAPGFPQLLFHRAEILDAMDRDAEAVRLLEKVLESNFAERPAAEDLLKKLNAQP